MEMLNTRGRSKSKHKFGGTKVCEAEEEREYFINPIKLKMKLLTSV